MKRLIITLTLCGLFAMLAAQELHPPMPDYWTRYVDMKATMDSLQAAFPMLIQVESLGQSDTQNIDIWCAKISNNAQTRRDVPRILIIGSIHAEEVIGNEIAMKLMRDLIYKRNIPPYSDWLANLEIFIVPTMNPEGLAIVMDGGDNSYRKNVKDADGNGLFDFVPGVGYDRDGIDLNRNWDINWVHGDTLLSVAGFERYDYYRGEYPFSEGENIAIRNLAYREKFVFAIVWHSSRTGNVEETVYTPYNFSKLRQAPDWDVNKTIGEGVAYRIDNEAGTGKYSAFAAEGRRGDQHVWFYTKLGTVMLLIECGTSNLQPALPLLQSTIARCTVGMNWLINRALSGGNGQNPRPMLTGLIKDAVTQEPLEAEIIIHNRAIDAVPRVSEVLSPRLSNAEHGRFWRPLLDGNYTATIRKKGYEPFETNFEVNLGRRTIQVALQPLTPIDIHLTIHANSQPVSAVVTLSDPCGDDEYLVEGTLIIHTFVGNRTLTIIPTNGVPFQQEFDLTHSGNIDVNVGTANILFTEDFNTDLNNWVVESGPWQIVTDDNKTFLTDSWGGYGFYEPGADVSVRTANTISIPATGETYLLFDQHLHTEFEHDYVSISASTDLEEWETVWTQAGKYDFWHTKLVNLSGFAGENIYLRFRLEDDTSDFSGIVELVDPGWSVDNIKIINGAVTTSIADEFVVKPAITLKQNYPNPFNHETHIAFNIINTKFNQANIDIFNIKGQKVQSIDITEPDLKNSYVLWNADKLATGVYFYRLTVDGEHFGVKKAVLLK